MSMQEKNIERAKEHVSYFESTVGRLKFQVAIAASGSPPDVAAQHSCTALYERLTRCERDLEKWRYELLSLKAGNAPTR